MKLFSLLEHTKVHKPYKCGECSKSFADKNYYKEHKRIHSGINTKQKQYSDKKMSIFKVN